MLLSERVVVALGVTTKCKICLLFDNSRCVFWDVNNWNFKFIMSLLRNAPVALLETMKVLSLAGKQYNNVSRLANVWNGFTIRLFGNKLLIQRNPFTAKNQKLCDVIKVTYFACWVGVIGSYSDADVLGNEARCYRVARNRFPWLLQTLLKLQGFFQRWQKP